MDYRDAMLYYYPDLNVKVVDRHFLEIFVYAKIEREELPILEAKDILEVSKGDEPQVKEAVPTTNVPKVSKNDELEVIEAVLTLITTEVPYRS